MTLFRGVAPDRSEVFRLFDEAFAQRRVLEARGVGLAFVARETELDSLLPLFHDFAESFAGPLNLLLAEADGPLPDSVPEALGCRHFATVAPWHRLPNAVLEAVLRHLVEGGLRPGLIDAISLGSARVAEAGWVGTPPADGAGLALGQAVRSGRGAAAGELERRLARVAA